MGILKSPHWETVTPEIKSLVAFIGQQEFSNRFYLAGGTALALQMGHRLSIDLDFFSEKDEVHDRTRYEIVKAFESKNCQVIENVDGNLLMLVQNIHVGFFSYGYKLLQPAQSVENVSLAAPLDIGLMKLDALIGRGSRKDFYDVYVISQHIPLVDLLEAGRKKYPQLRDFAIMAIESMVLFENGDRDIQPAMFIDLSWDELKKYFIEQAKALGDQWFDQP